MLLADRRALAGTGEFTTINAGLSYPFGQTAHRNTEAQGDSFCLLLRREPPTGAAGVGHQSNVWWSWRFSYRPVHQTGGSPHTRHSQAVQDCGAHQFDAAKLQLGADAFAVSLHGGNCEVQLLGNLLVE